MIHQPRIGIRTCLILIVIVIVKLIWIVVRIMLVIGTNEFDGKHYCLIHSYLIVRARSLVLIKIANGFDMQVKLYSAANIIEYQCVLQCKQIYMRHYRRYNFLGLYFTVWNDKRWFNNISYSVNNQIGYHILVVIVMRPCRIISARIIRMTMYLTSITLFASLIHANASNVSWTIDFQYFVML